MSSLKLMRRHLSLFLLIWVMSTSASAQQMYIDDTLFVPLRSGEGTSFRIVHKGLKSGTRVEVVEQNKSSGYAKIRTSGGTEGYLPTRYLVAEPIARVKLASLTTELAQIKSQKQSADESLSLLKTEHETLLQQFEALSSKSAQTESELTNVKNISSNAIQLDAQNRELNEANEKLMGELELIKIENARLKDNKESEMFIYGGILVVLGVILAIVIPTLKPAKKSENWV